MPRRPPPPPPPHHQAAEAHSDLAYWRTDPSALMAGDIDELERLMVVPPAPPQRPGSVPLSSNGLGSPRASGELSEAVSQDPGHRRPLLLEAKGSSM
jgi:hypothetical protein